MFTLEEILKAWETCYGEDMKENYAGFIEELGVIQKLKNPTINLFTDKLLTDDRIIPILWEFISEKDINAILQKLKEQNL